ncbi:MAG TPA: PspC domain-containing protein [Candidatus Deferrimicrobium sp.]|nr:PspC domain-containing protein [Candidatus Deferrimicrobium sp.]
MRQRRLRRSEDERVIAGVCGGIAAYLGSDVTWVRIAWVIVTLLTSALPMVVIYVLLAAVLPTAPSARGASDEERAEALHERPPSGVGARPDWPIAFGILLLAVGGMLLVSQYVPLSWEVLWPVSLIALGLVVIVIALRPRFGGRR